MLRVNIGLFKDNKTFQNSWHQKLINFNVLQQRACAKPALLHCQQAGASFGIYLNSWLSSRHPKIHSHIGTVVSTTLEYYYISATSVYTTMSSGNLFKTCRWLPDI